MKKILYYVLILILVFSLCSCGEEKIDVYVPDYTESILSKIDNFDDLSKPLITKDFLKWIEKNFGNDILEKLDFKIRIGNFKVDDWYKITGNTIFVLEDLYNDVLNPQSQNYRSDIKMIESKDDITTLRFVGDVSLADNWKIAPKIDKENNGMLGVLSKETIDLLKNADVFLLNNEFTYSNRGKALSGKAFTFRANPNRAKLLHQIGADIVSLANNHAYDFGPDAFEDTLQTLKGENIPYIGAGSDVREAAKPFYFIVNGRKYGFSAATKAEKNIKTPEAKEDSSGVMRTYEPEKYINTIKAAEQECDYNIVYVHWGAEGKHTIEDGLYEMGSKFINAGADVVIGSHAHVLQGVQYYNNVPIIYNLGNFIFNDQTMDTGIFEINISKGNDISYKFIPAIQKDCYTQLANPQEKQRILEFMESLSIDVKFDSEGYITRKQ